MQFRTLGGSGIEASVVGLGTWALGGWMWGGADETDAIRAIRASLDEGVTLVDTAPIYGLGRSEELVGEAIAGRRDEVVLATKCALRWDQEIGQLHFYADDKGVAQEGSKYKVYKCLRPESIAEEVERSLKRLRTDRIDLYQTHWQEETTPIADTAAFLEKLKDQGKIRAIGVSNVEVRHLDGYERARPGQAVVASAQERFSMFERKIERNGVLDWCKKHGVAVLAYSPLEQGLLTGKLTPEREFGEGDVRKDNPRYSVERRRQVLAMLEEFRPIADRCGATFSQLAIAWTAAYPGVTHVLVGARDEKQARENAAGGAIKLRQEDRQTMDEIIARYH